MAVQVDFREVLDDEVDHFVVLFGELFHHDFSGYSRASLRRRILRLMRIMECDSYGKLKYQLVNNNVDARMVLNEITVNTTEMYRDPEVFEFINTHILPHLDTYPQLKIWHAASSSGEEVYSLATMLHEAGMLEKSIQYATDINSDVLVKAKEAIYDIKDMKLFTDNYLKSGGKKPFSEYYTTKYRKAKFKDFLKKNIVFSRFDLVSGSSFNAFELILCRNVLIYFDEQQQDKVIELLIDSLAPNGFLVLGNKETIKKEALQQRLEVVNKKYRIYKKIC